MKFISVLKNTITIVATATLLTACGSYGGNYPSKDSYGSNDGYGSTNTSAPAKKVLAQNADAIGGPIARVSTAIGEVIAGGSEEMTLYYFAKDSDGVSNCDGACAAAWPPFMADNPALATDILTTVERSDGTIQWAIQGKPLYFWAGDTQRGDTTGNDVSNWSVARAQDL